MLGSKWCSDRGCWKVVWQGIGLVNERSVGVHGTWFGGGTGLCLLKLIGSASGGRTMGS